MRELDPPRTCDRDLARSRRMRSAARHRCWHVNAGIAELSSRRPHCADRLGDLVRIGHRQRAGLADADERRARRPPPRSWPAPDGAAGSASASGARSTMRLRNGSFSAAAAKRVVRPGPVTTISAARSRRSSALSSAAWLQQVVGRAASTPSNSRSACSRHAVVAGQRREPHQVLRRDRVRIGGGVVAGRSRPHHQALGVVGGEEIAAVVRIGVVRVEARAARRAPARDRRARRSPRTAPAPPGSCWRSRRRARDRAAGRRARNGRAGRPWSCCAR